MKVVVEQSDIDIARQTNSFSLTGFCPIARTLKRKLKKQIRVGNANHIVINKDIYVVKDNPDLVQKFIDDFDDGKKIKPIQFELVKKHKT